MITAFALSGLGGFNAHGAGFLTAARDRKVAPDIVTVTSGQIIVLDLWMRGENLREALIESEGGSPWSRAMMTALFGKDDVFRTAWKEAGARWLSPISSGERLFDYIANRFLPAEMFVPVRPDGELEKMAERFRESPIGIVFNAYDVQTGKGVLYGNKAAHPHWPRGDKLRAIDASADPHGETEPTLRAIDGEAIKAALWLSLYGFEKAPGQLLDGAYHRACLVSELHGCDRVYAVRPIAKVRPDRVPRNAFEVKDWETEMWFSVGYQAEVAGMKRINELVRDERITPPKKGEPDFRMVDLIEIEAELAGGFFDYFNEQGAVFDSAFDIACRRFDEKAAKDAVVAAVS